jgi:hypothetical protein
MPLEGDWQRAELVRSVTLLYKGGLTTGCSGRRCALPLNQGVRRTQLALRVL